MCRASPQKPLHNTCLPSLPELLIATGVMPRNFACGSRLNVNFCKLAPRASTQPQKKITTHRARNQTGTSQSVSLELDTSWDQVVAPVGVGIPSRSQNR